MTAQDDHRKLISGQGEAFVENKGQWDAQALFLARSPGTDVWITRDGVVYDFHRYNDLSGKKPAFSPARPVGLDRGARQGHVVRMSFVGGRASAVSGHMELAGKHNYLLGNNRGGWGTGARRFEEALAEQVYEGVAARHYFDQSRARYDLVVAPGADPSKIALRFEGSAGVGSLGTTLRLGTSLGAVEHRGLFAYQQVDGGKRQVPCGFSVKGDVVRFDVGDYDRSRPLVIDPIVYCSFLGGSNADSVYTATKDADGNNIVGGETYSTNFPTTTGAYSETKQPTYSDAFITKLSPDGSTLLWSTYFGGSSTEYPTGVAVDSVGNVVFCGDAASGDLPTTVGSYQPTDLGYGKVNGFVAKLDEDGDSLSWCTYLSGTDINSQYGLAVDSLDRVYVAGSAGQGYPTTAGAYRTTASMSDATLSRLSADGSTLQASTYVGGMSPDWAYGVALDSSERPVIGGHTGSSDFFTTVGAHQAAPSTSTDGFVARLNRNLTTLEMSTCIGGGSVEYGNAVAVDGSDNVILGGATLSADFPATYGTFRGDPTDDYEGFVAKVTPNGKRLLGAAILGGTVSDSVYAITADAAGNPIACGISSVFFPVTSDADQKTTPYNGKNGFVTKLNINLRQLLFSTLWGGQYNTAVACNGPGDLLLGGYTKGVEVRGSAIQTTYGGAGDGMVALLRLRHHITLSPGNVPGGRAATGRVWLAGPAPAGGTEVLVSANTQAVGPAMQVLVPAGALGKSFEIGTMGVNSKMLAVLTATAGGESATTELTVNPASLRRLNVSKASILGGKSVDATVALNGEAGPSGVLVAVTRDNAAASVPPSVTVSANQSTATFKITTSVVTTDTVVTVSGKHNGVTRTDSFTVLAP